MKKIFYFATAAVLMAGCSSDSIVDGGYEPQPTNEDAAIVFSTVSKGTTRADHVGADAAALLGNKFIVGGFKGGGPVTATDVNTGKVFDNYIVEWTENTAATTESNTSDWEYVGKTPAATATITGPQTIKYWDYSAAQYDFIAYSLKDKTLVAKTNDNINTGTPNSNEVWVTPIDPEHATTNAYKLRGSAADLEKCFIADMVTAYKEDKTPPQPKFKEEVKLTFRSLASKVRIALYETVPGYSVKDVKFYTAEATTQPITTPATGTNATLFTTGTADKDNFYTAGIYTVKFLTIGSSNISNADYNKAHVEFAADAAGKATTKNFGTLNFVGKDSHEAEITQYIGRTSATASFAGTASPDNYYSIAMPNEDGTVLELRVDYTLLSIDGSGEEIKVHGATAYVPAVYAQWKPNYAYTYIFKISDNTNGWTSTVESEPAGLYPITFDAVVVDSEEKTQSTITTVATPSITTYQKGHDITKDEYLASTGDIYVQVISDGTLKSDLGTKGQLYTLSAAKTEAEVMDALNIQAASTETTITGRNGLVLTEATSDATITTVPGADGNNITVTAGTAAKFTATAGTTYAYVYDATPTPAPASSYYYSAEKPATKPTDWGTAWYKDPNGSTPVAEEDWAADKVFYKKYTNLNKVYGVKVIKVVAAP